MSLPHSPSPAALTRQAGPFSAGCCLSARRSCRIEPVLSSFHRWYAGLPCVTLASGPPRSWLARPASGIYVGFIWTALLSFSARLDSPSGRSRASMSSRKFPHFDVSLDAGRRVKLRRRTWLVLGAPQPLSCSGRVRSARRTSHFTALLFFSGVVVALVAAVAVGLYTTLLSVPAQAKASGWNQGKLGGVSGRRCRGRLVARSAGGRPGSLLRCPAGLPRLHHHGAPSCRCSALADAAELGKPWRYFVHPDEDGVFYCWSLEARVPPRACFPPWPRTTVSAPPACSGPTELLAEL
jgi:hypothetical protein